MLWCECWVDRNTTDWSFLGMFEASVELFVQLKIDDFSSRCLFGIILISGCRPTSDSVGSMTSESGVVENVGVATGISLISQSCPEI